MKVYYKIRDKNTGLFSTGGVSPKWTKKGKVWTSEGHVKSHLTLLKEHHKYRTCSGWGNKHAIALEWTCPKNWEIVVTVYEEIFTKSYAASDVAERKAKK